MKKLLFLALTVSSSFLTAINLESAYQHPTMGTEQIESTAMYSLSSLSDQDLINGYIASSRGFVPNPQQAERYAAELRRRDYTSAELSASPIKPHTY